ncbi:EamA-like transporter family protein [Cohaesibacter sp. ES.047]|uniref:DMT family transporter n=1 Tax=Cohaesibacter sp. ES.047 TaxID=1798205 RepID=UPI000BC06BC9|nr:DMT family transporter [Cohaesibacter sp. ES.047]SNY90763.1 EamA-like transporter family protein [Cohaesibacter sp. ES.047]
MKSGAVPSGIQTNMGSIEWAMLLSLSLLWGGSFFFVGVAVKALPTFTIVVLRVGLAAGALWVYIFITGRAVPRRAPVWLAFLGMGALNNVIPFSLIVWGQQSIASGLASILNAATPLFGVLVAGLLLADEKISARKLAGVIIGLAGVAVMMGLDALHGLGGNIIGQMAILTAALSYAFAGVFGRRFKDMHIDPVVTAAGQVTASTILLAPVALIVDAPLSLPMPALTVWAALGGLALISTALAYVLYFQLLARAGATNLLLVTLLIPATAILLGWLFLNERLGLVHIVGMGLIGLGLLVLDGRLLNFFSKVNRT